MKKAYMAVAVLSLTIAGAAADGAGAHPVFSNAVAWNGGEYGNPAFLGLDGAPERRLAILPFTAGLRGGELALSLPTAINKYLWEGDIPRYVTYLLNESFDLWGIRGGSAELERSQKLTGELKGGTVGLSAGVGAAPVVFSMSGMTTPLMNGFSASIRTYASLDLKLPGDLLLPFVSRDEGLLRGNALDLSALEAGAIAATELAFKAGRPIDVLPGFFDYLNMDKGAWGVGVKQILGHSYVSASAKDGSRVEYDDSSNAAIIDAKFDVVQVGTGLNLGKSGGRLNLLDSDDMDGVEWFNKRNSPLGSPVTGWGWGVDLGAAFHNSSHFLSVDMRDIGLIVWNGRKAREGTVSFEGSTSALTSETESVKIKDYFEITMENTGDSRENLVTWLPMSLNLGYTYYDDLSGRAEPELTRWVNYWAANAAVRQQLVTGPGKNTYIPELSLGGMAGLLKNGILPLRYGIILGGPGTLGSVVGAGINTRHFSFDLFWKTFGNPFMFGRKGFEAASLFTVNWGKNGQRTAGNDVADAPVSNPPAAMPPAMDAEETKAAGSVLTSGEDNGGSAPEDGILTPEPVYPPEAEQEAE